MIADWFTRDGKRVEFGSYTPLARSIPEAASEAAIMFDGIVSIVGCANTFAIVSVGDKRIVIGER